MNSGTVIGLYLKEGAGAPMKQVDAATAVSGQGLQGDASYGKAKRQVLLIEWETLKEFALEPGQVRENITTMGVELAGLPAGSRLCVGPTVLEVTLDCAPCQFIEEIRPGLREEIRGRRGTLARVLEGGPVSVGDAVTVEG